MSYHLFAAGSVEERILGLQRSKRHVADAILGNGQASSVLSENDVDVLFAPLGAGKARFAGGNRAAVRYRRRVRLFSLPAALAVLLSAASAGANEAGAHPWRSFYVDGKDPECAADAGALAEAITVACDVARASCRASTAPGGADRRLVLDCQATDRWSLDAFDASGTLEWTTDLAGPNEDRLREGAAAAVRTVTEDEPHPAPLPLVMADGPRPAGDRIEPPASVIDLPKVLVFGGFALAVVGTTVGVVLAIDHANRSAPVEEPPVGRSCSDGPCVEPIAESSPSRGPGDGRLRGVQRRGRRPRDRHRRSRALAACAGEACRAAEHRGHTGGRARISLGLRGTF